MNGALLLLFTVSMLVVGAIAGDLAARYFDRRSWQKHGYCPTCDRLACEATS